MLHQLLYYDSTIMLFTSLFIILYITDISSTISLIGVYNPRTHCEIPQVEALYYRWYWVGPRGFGINPGSINPNPLTLLVPRI